MALSKPNQAAATNTAFEDEATTGAAEVVESKAKDVTEAQAKDKPATEAAEKVEKQAEPSTDKADTADASTGTEVAEVAPKASALALKGGGGAAALMKTNVFTDTKDAFPIDFDSVPRIKAEQGEMILADGEHSLGKWVELQVISYQEHWVATPSDNDADKELLKYSDDGKTASDGTDLAAHVEALKDQGYPKAKIAHRMRIVGELVAVANDSPEGAAALGSLMQIDLPESGRRSFKNHSLQATFAVAKKRYTVEQVHRLKFTADKAKTDKNEVYTKTLVGFAG